MNLVKNQLKGALMISVFLLCICGIIYPVLSMIAGQIFFPHQANGSLIVVNREIKGSELAGQNFVQPYFFHGRPSAVQYSSYDRGTASKDLLPSSGGSNLSANDPELKKRMQKDIKKITKLYQVNADEIQPDLITASSSGLDPHITKKSAEMQLKTVSHYSNISVDELKKYIDNHSISNGQYEYVNVLKLNLDIQKNMKQVQHS